MDWGSAIFLRNWAALETREDRIVHLTHQRNQNPDCDFSIYGTLPFIGRVIILDATFHVLQFVQHCKHVNEFAQSEQVGLRHKVFPSFGVAQTLHFTTEPFYSFPLRRQRNQDLADNYFNTDYMVWKGLIWSGLIQSKILKSQSGSWILPGSTWTSWAWSLQVLIPPLFSHRSPLCLVARCISPSKHKRAASYSLITMSSSVSSQL